MVASEGFFRIGVNSACSGAADHQIGEICSNDQHDHNGAAHGEQLGEHAGEHLFHKLPHLAGVVHHPVHQLAGLPLVHKGKREHVNLDKHPAPQIPADPGAQPVAQHRAGDAAGQRHRKQRQHQEEQTGRDDRVVLVREL